MKKHELQTQWQDAAFVNSNSRLLHDVFVGKKFTDNADLRGLIIGLDGAMDSLLWENLHEVKISEVDFSFGNFSCSFYQSDFTNVNFDNAEFDTCRMMKSHFYNCSFKDAILDCPSFSDAKFIDCNFEGAVIKSRGHDGYGGRRAIFERCRFNKTTFQRLKLLAFKFSDCSFDNATFKKCMLSGVSFNGGAPLVTDFQNCELLQCSTNDHPI